MSVTETTAEAVIPVDDISQLINVLTAWHNHQIKTIHHLHDVPEGTEVSIGDEDKFKLEGDALKGFKVGIQLCLNYLGTLPIVAEYDDEPVAH
jgi:hypothetical protein